MFRPVVAYLDGGTGSLLLQVILGGTAGLAVAWKTWRYRLRRRFGRATDDELEASADASGE